MSRNPPPNYSKYSNHILPAQKFHGKKTITTTTGIWEPFDEIFQRSFNVDPSTNRHCPTVVFQKTMNTVPLPTPLVIKGQRGLKNGIYGH